MPTPRRRKPAAFERHPAQPRFLQERKGGGAGGDERRKAIEKEKARTRCSVNKSMTGSADVSVWL